MRATSLDEASSGHGMARLHIYDGQDRLHSVDLGDEPTIIGRDEWSGVVLEDASVSRRHAQIEPTGNFFLVRDLKSTNGTYVNDMLVRVRLLTHGDVVRVGRYLLRVDAGHASRKESTRIRVDKLDLGSDHGIDESARPSVSPASREQQRCQDFKRLSDTIGQLTTRDELYRTALEYLLAELEADRCGILCFDEEDRERAICAENLRSVAALSTGGDETVSEIRIDPRTLNRALGASEAIVCDVLGVESRGGAMVAPLRDRGAVQGVVYVDRVASARRFDDDQRLYFDLMVRQIAISLRNAELFEDVIAERGKVQAILTSLTEGIVMTDPGFQVTDANLAAVALLELRKVNPIGCSFFDLLRGFDASPSLRLLTSEAAEGSAVFHLRRHGASRTAEETPDDKSLAGRIVPFPQRGPQPQGFVVTLRDATTSWRLEKLKSAFISNVAHKLRTPLTVIRADLPLLVENFDSPVRHELLEELDRNSRRLTHLVDQFVEFSEMDLRSVTEADMPAPATLFRIVAGAVRAKRAVADEKGIRIDNRVPPDLPPLRVRAARLGDAIERIVDNSVKFSPANSQVVLQAEAAEGLLKLHITDEGPGIPGEELDAVFCVGHQVDLQGAGQIPGAGLGLTIARHIVQEHGGEIRISSPYPVDGHGARISLMLPLEPEGAGAYPSEPREGGEASRGR